MENKDDYQTNKDFHQRKIYIYKSIIIFHCRITVAKSDRHYNVAVGKLVNREQINYDEIKIWNEFLSTYNVSQIILALVSKVIGPAIKSNFKSCSFEWMKLSQHLVWVICEYLSSSIALKITWILFEHYVWILNQLHIFCSLVPYPFCK